MDGQVSFYLSLHSLQNEIGYMWEKKRKLKIISYMSSTLTMYIVCAGDHVLLKHTGKLNSFGIIKVAHSVSFENFYLVIFHRNQII